MSGVSLLTPHFDPSVHLRTQSGKETMNQLWKIQLPTPDFPVLFLGVSRKLVLLAFLPKYSCMAGGHCPPLGWPGCSLTLPPAATAAFSPELFAPSIDFGSGFIYPCLARPGRTKHLQNVGEDLRTIRKQKKRKRQTTFNWTLDIRAMKLTTCAHWGSPSNPHFLNPCPSLTTTLQGSRCHEVSLAICFYTKYACQNLTRFDEEWRKKTHLLSLLVLLSLFKSSSGVLFHLSTSTFSQK